MIDDPERCYLAAKSKDARFDGVFVTGVLTTGIYCRPSCPARTPRRENVRFFATAAAAQQAGLRACLRCRPDATPGSPEWNVRADVVARAMRLIRDGVVDRDGVGGLSERLGYSERHLNRLLGAEVGAGPLALARAQRSQNARTLLETTDLPITQIAFAAGFDSVRQCNDTIRQIFARTPRELRQRSNVTRTSHDWAAHGIELRLPARRPFSAESVLAFLGMRAIAGVEEYDGATFRRSLRLPRGHGIVEFSSGTENDHGPAFVLARLYLSDLRDLTAAVARCRQLLDLDADPIAVLEALGDDPWIGPLVASQPGRRIAGAVDGFELAVRAIVGQQVSVAGARTVAARLVGAAGEALAEPRGGVTHLFPTPDALLALASADPSIFPMPGARRRALVALAHVVHSDGLVIDPGADPIELRRSLVALFGVGPWTAEYVAMRVLRDPDAFLAGDLGIRRAAAAVGLPDDPRALARAAESWRPWRSYAMAHLWALPIDTAATTNFKETP